MKKLLALLAVAALVAGCAAKQPVKEFHPTDDVNSNAQGGKGETSDGSEVDFGLGLLYYYGYIVPEQKSKAIKLFKESTALGYNFASTFLNK